MKRALMIAAAMVASLAIGATSEAGRIVISSGHTSRSHSGHSHSSSRVRSSHVGYGHSRVATSRYSYSSPRYSYSTSRFNSSPRFSGNFNTRYRGGYYHDTSHWDYHAPSLQRHGHHYDYVPGHYDYHRTGHFHR